MNAIFLSLCLTAGTTGQNFRPLLPPPQPVPAARFVPVQSPAPAPSIGAPTPSPDQLLLPQTPPPGAAPVLPPPAAPLPPGSVVPVPVVPVVQRPLTLQEFKNVFTPVPGTHQVTFVHPWTKRPVDVNFQLPPGYPKVKAGLRTLRFDYGKREVELIFRIGGAVDVRYH